MRRYGLKVILIFSLFVVFQSAFSSDCNIARVAGRVDNAPISSAVRNALVGIGHTALQRSLPEQLEIELSPPLPWSRTLNQSRAGNIDIIVGLHKTDDRVNDYEFIEPPLINTAQTIFFLKENTSLKNWQDLKVLRGGMLRGMEFGTEFSDYLKNNLNVSEISSVGQGVILLARHKRIDYLISPLLPTIHHVQRYFPKILSRITFLKKPAAVTEEYIAISKRSTCVEHIGAISNNLSRIIVGGAFDTLLRSELEKWKAVEWYMDNISY